MKLEFEEHDQLAIAKLKGDLTSEWTDRMRKDVLGKMDNQVRDFVLDMTDLEFIDSQGLETILWLQDTCAEQLGQVRLANMPENVETILTMTRLTNRFEAHSTVEAAIRSLR